MYCQPLPRLLVFLGLLSPYRHKVGGAGSHRCRDTARREVLQKEHLVSTRHHQSNGRHDNMKGRLSALVVAADRTTAKKAVNEAEAVPSVGISKATLLPR